MGIRNPSCNSVAFNLFFNTAVCTTFLCAVCRRMGAADVWLWLIEFSGVALSCFTFSRLTIPPDVPLTKPEDSFNPVSWVRKLVNTPKN